ncbi:MAG: hypothetical protein HKP51_06525 [Sulfitobacter sp.]|nr:hypothetical protein [Sulfitobacter sp.]
MMAPFGSCLAGGFRYYHFLCDQHQIVFAEGCPAESLFPGAQTLESVDIEARNQIIRIFPQLALDDSDSTLSRYTLSAREASTLHAVA